MKKLKCLKRIVVSVIALAMIFGYIYLPSNVRADDTSWQSNFTYSLSTSDTILDADGNTVTNTITIHSYSGPSGVGQSLVIPAEAEITGVKYTTVLDGTVGTLVLSDTQFDSVTIDSGVLLKNGTDYFADVYAGTWNVADLYTGSAVVLDGMFRSNGTYDNGVINLTGWNVSSVVSADEMFYGNTSTSIVLKNWNVNSLVSADRFFYNCKNLESVDLSTWQNASSIESALDFIYLDTPGKLKTVDLSALDFTHSPSGKEGSICLNTSVTESAGVTATLLHSVKMPAILDTVVDFSVKINQSVTHADGTTDVYTNNDYKTLKVNKTGYNSVNVPTAAPFVCNSDMSLQTIVFGVDHANEKYDSTDTTGHLCSICGYRYESFPIIKYYNADGSTLLYTEYVSGSTPTYTNPSYAVWLDADGDNAANTVFTSLTAGNVYSVYGKLPVVTPASPVSIEVVGDITVKAGSNLSGVQVKVTYDDGTSSVTSAWISNYNKNDKSLGERGVLFYLSSDPSIYTYKVINVIADATESSSTQETNTAQESSTTSTTDEGSTTRSSIVCRSRDYDSSVLSGVTATLIKNNTTVSQKSVYYGSCEFDYLAAGEYKLVFSVDEKSVDCDIVVTDDICAMVNSNSVSGYYIEASSVGNTLYVTLTRASSDEEIPNHTGTEDEYDPDDDNENKWSQVEDEFQDEGTESVYDPNDYYEDEPTAVPDHNLTDSNTSSNPNGSYETTNQESYGNQNVSGSVDDEDEEKESAENVESGEKVTAPKTGDFYVTIVFLFVAAFGIFGYAYKSK